MGKLARQFFAGQEHLGRLNDPSMARPKESWNSRIGVILAVSGSAVGLGNFLRFPGQAAQYGGGAFMLAYFVAFLLIGLPICWAEWTMGRRAGQHGFNSCPGIFAYITRHPVGMYLGAIGIVIPVVVYMYYVYIEAWCLGYSVNFLRGEMAFPTAGDAGAFWEKFIGNSENGAAVGFGLKEVGIYLLVAFVLNFYLIYRGLAKGIELFCKFAMPTLIVLAMVVLVRVLTLGSPDETNPHNSVANGLGFMWNPSKVMVQEAEEGTYGSRRWVNIEELVGAELIAAKRAEMDGSETRRVVTITVWQQLRNPQLWLAAAGQIFFSLSVGFGILMTYSSYLSKSDDVVLSGLAATSTNEFCEVGLGGLITVPAGFAFLGVAGVAGQGTFALGFKVLPMVFSNMPAGQFFGFLFFFLLFLAAVTSSLSMVQPGIAFLEETMEINRKQSVAILGVITAFGTGFVVYFSKDSKALDTFDFWVGTFLIFILATIQIITFAWVLGLDEGFKEAHQGAAIRIPRIYRVIMKYICPLFLITVFLLWVVVNVFGYSFETGETNVSGYIMDLVGKDSNIVAQMSIGLIVILGVFVALVISRVKRYNDLVFKPKGMPIAD